MSNSCGLSAKVHALGRWQRRLLALTAGAVSVLAFAPFFAWPVLFLTLPVLVWLIDAVLRDGGPRAAFRAGVLGWWFGFGFFLVGLYWIGAAFLVEAEKFAILLPVAVTVMPAGLALFWAGAAAAASRLWLPGWPRVLVLALTLSLAEWLRGHVLTGFPWNVLGYALTAPDALMQGASVLGIYGLTVVVIVAAGLPVVAFCDGSSTGERRGALIVSAVLSALPLAVLAVWGGLRLAAPGAGVVDGVHLRIVQASIPQAEKWQAPFQRRNFERHLELSRSAAKDGGPKTGDVQVIVWPEAAMPFRPLELPDVLAALGGIIPERGYLAAGVLRVEATVDGEAGGRRQRVFNSIAMLGEGGKLLQVYDKIHLVPFGEYLPLQSTLEAIGLEQLTRIRGGFNIGVVPRPLLSVGGVPVLGPLICYEAIFPGAVVQGSERPKALLNLTNDGWFGVTIGPHQHFHQARVRAVEEGLALIRSANNGISAIVDARGQVVQRLGQNEIGVIDGAMPKASEPTIYSRFGDGMFWLMVMVLAGFVLLRRQDSLE